MGNREAPPTTIPTDLRVNTTALNAVTLSSVAKYWVLTNLLPGPIPQVSVYGLPASARSDSQNKPQDAMLAQHAGLLSTDNILLQQHTQIPVSISSQTVTNLAIPAGALHIAQNGQQEVRTQQNDAQSMSSDNHVVQLSHSQMNQSSHSHNSQQQNLVQVQVDDDLVSVIEDSKDHKELLTQAHIHITDGQAIEQQTLTVQQIQQLQVDMFNKFLNKWFAIPSTCK